jgi:hypothetical protein
MGKQNTASDTLAKLKFSPLEDQDKFGVLSDEDVEKIRLDVQAQVLEERKKQAKDALRQKLLAEERRTQLPDEDLIELQMNLPGHMDRIVLDQGHYPNGGVYHHGQTYKVDANKYATLQEIINRAWAHEESTGIPNHRTYRRPSNMAIGNYVDPTISGLRTEREVRINPTHVNTPAQTVLHG